MQSEHVYGLRAAGPTLPRMDVRNYGNKTTTKIGAHSSGNYTNHIHICKYTLI